MSQIGTAVASQRAKPSLAQLVEQMKPEIARALPKGMDADRMARLALTVLRKTPDLAKCTPDSFLGALLTASALGLEPGVDDEAYLVPYGTECTFIAGYKGIAKLFFNHPLARHLDAQAVHENDFFEYEMGLDPYLRHKPARGDRGKVTEFYAVASLTTGAKFFVVLSPEDVAAIRGASGKRRPSVADPMHWLERKTALRQLFKLVPKSTQLHAALTSDERSGADLLAHKVPEAISTGTVAQLESGEHVDVATGEILPVEEPPGWEA
jgi:recombination protein RecT